MLAPKRILHRKVQRGSMKGQAKGNTQLYFGDYGIKALEAHWITGYRTRNKKKTSNALIIRRRKK